MKVYDVDQGSPEWFQVRAGVLTASNVKTARERLRDGSFSAASRKLAYRLALERISGTALQDEKFQTYAMRRGQELEPEARACHEALGVVVRRAGFVTTEDGRLGASVDGFIDPVGAAEYKCLVNPEELMSIFLERDLSSFKDQMQTGLFVTGRQWFHFGLYCPFLKEQGMEFTLIRENRDPVWAISMKRDIAEFLHMVDVFQATLLARRTELHRLQVEAMEQYEQALLN